MLCYVIASKLYFLFYAELCSNRTEQNITKKNMLYNMCHVMLYNMCHVMLYMCHVMLYTIKYVVI